MCLSTFLSDFKFLLPNHIWPKAFEYKFVPRYQEIAKKSKKKKGSWGGKEGDLLSGMGITALGEKRETEAKCAFPGTPFLYVLRLCLFKQGCCPWC